MIYDHTQCAPDAHDRDPGTGVDDGQPVDEQGLTLCRDCDAPLMYCTTFADYDHAEPGTPPCALVHRREHFS